MAAPPEDYRPETMPTGAMGASLPDMAIRRVTSPTEIAAEELTSKFFGAVGTSKFIYLILQASVSKKDDRVM
jgi:hypothetical protein